MVCYILEYANLSIIFVISIAILFFLSLLHSFSQKLPLKSQYFHSLYYNYPYLCTIIKHKPLNYN